MIRKDCHVRYDNALYTVENRTDYTNHTFKMYERCTYNVKKLALEITVCRYFVKFQVYVRSSSNFFKEVVRCVTVSGKSISSY